MLCVLGEKCHQPGKVDCLKIRSDTLERPCILSYGGRGTCQECNDELFVGDHFYYKIRSGHLMSLPHYK